MEWIIIGFKIGIGLALAILAIVVIAMIVIFIVVIFDGPLEELYCGRIVVTVLIGLVVLFTLVRLISC